MTLWYIEWLHITVHITHTLVSTVTSSLPLLGSAFQRRTFPCPGVSKRSPASATSFYQQQLTMAELQQFSNYNCKLVLLITSRHGPRRKHLFYYYCILSLLWKHVCLRSRYLVLAVVQLLISRSLSSNGSTCHNILQERVTFPMVIRTVKLLSTHK
jgi:hypothetical protein